MNRSLDIGLLGWSMVVGLLVAGLGAFIGTVAYTIVGGVGSLLRVEVPGEHQFKLRAGGAYTIFHEYPRTPDKLGIARPPGAEGLQLTLKSVEGEVAIPLEHAEGEDRYTLRLMAGESWYRFRIPEGGDFRLSAQYPEGQQGPATAITFKRNHAELLLGALLRGAAILLVTAVAVIATVIAFLKIRAREHPLDVEFKV